MFSPSKLLARIAKALPSPRRDQWFWLEWGPILLSALLLTTIWSFTLVRLEQEERLVVEHARTNQQNLAQIIAENLRQVVDRGTLYALMVDGWVRNGGQPLAANLSAMLMGDRAYNRVTLFDQDGRQVHASSPATLHPDLKSALKGYVAEIRNGTPPPVRVGPLSRAYGESWQVPLLLPITRMADGRVAVLMLQLDLGYLLQLYQDIDLGRNGMIQIQESNGIELARTLGGGLEIHDPATGATSLIGDAADRGTRIVPRSADQRPYLVSFNHVQGYPFRVTVSQDLAETKDQFQTRKHKYLVSLTILTLIVLLMTAMVVIMVRRQGLYFDAVVRSEREKRGLIEQLEDEKQHANQLASLDHLTGLANRRMFMSLAASHLARAQRSRQYYALMFIDLDRFKAINDSLGHKVGDLLLQKVARRLRDNLRESDVMARFGGDEFVILITGVEQTNDIVAIADKLVATIGRPYTDLDGHDVQISPSIGVAVFPRDGHDLDTLIRHADLAMYQSKKAGRGCHTFFDPALNVNSALDFDLEQRLPRAIDAGEFVLHFQPKVELQQFRITGLEALVRWQHPEHGLIFPGDFIPLAEATGHIVALGDWVIAAACRQLAEWRSEGLAVLPVAINLSARQLGDMALASRIVACLAEHGLEPELMQVEVTESSLIEKIEEADSLLSQLVAAGVKVALDDFGNGFSSLSYIKTLPIDTIKIDRGFIHDILNSHDDSVIVQSTIALAHNLGMRVVAEGVETRAQLIHLKTAGCDEVQGYFLSRPVAAAEVREMLLNPVRMPT